MHRGAMPEMTMDNNSSERGKLTLLTYPGHLGEPSDSPFCVKAMCLLEIANLDWAPHYLSDPRKTPKGKMPVLRDGSKEIADSDHIRDYIEATQAFDFDKGLTAEQRGHARAIVRMVDEHLYFLLLCDRWQDDENWQHIRDAYFGDMPFLLKGIMTGMIRRQVVAQAIGQGSGRHTPEERLLRASKDIDAIKSTLGKKQFLFGDSPTSADASAVPMLRAIANSPTPTLLCEAVRNDADLMDYLQRGCDAMYPAKRRSADANR